MLFAISCTLAASAALPPAPRAALLQEAPDLAAVARAGPPSEPGRSVAEYFVSLAAFTAANAAGSAFLSQAHVTVSRGRAPLDGTAGLVGAGAFFALSPLAAAVSSWLVGNGSSAWQPSLGAAALGAYGTSLLAVAAGVGLAAANVDRGTAIGASTALYLAVPLGAVLLQNATKSERPIALPADAATARPPSAPEPAEPASPASRPAEVVHPSPRPPAPPPPEQEPPLPPPPLPGPPEDPAPPVRR